MLGLDANMGPDAAVAVMGNDCGEKVDDTMLWRSYGLVELAWRKRRRGLGWDGEHVAVQAHRLRHGDEWLDDAVRKRYGGFGGVVMFGALEAELIRRGVGLVLVREQVGDRQYWQPDAQVMVHVDAEAGAVQKIFSAFGWERSDGGYDQKAVWQQVKAIAAMSNSERLRWAERKQPEVAWWRLCCGMTSRRVSQWDEVHDRAKYVPLMDWMWDHAVQCGAYTPAQVALARAEFAANLDEWWPELAEHSHDALVADCMKHVSPKMSRDDKNLIDAAFQLRHGLSDTAGFDEMYARRMQL